MASVSSAVRNIAKQDKLLNEAMQQGILNYAAAAERIKAKVESETGSEVREATIVMALRRFSELAVAREKPKLSFDTEIVMKSGLAYLSFSKDPRYLERLLGFYRKLRMDRDTFNIIHGDREVSIITNEKHAKGVKEVMGRANMRNEEKDLVSISMTLGRDFAYVPGMIYTITKRLFWANVNVFELLTTATELTILFQQKDATRAYSVIYELSKEK